MSVFRTRVALATAVAAMIEDTRIGITALIDNQNGPKRLGQYVSVGYPLALHVGEDEQQYRNQTGPGEVDLNETSMGFRELRFSVTVLRNNDSGDSAVDAAERIRTVVRKAWAKEFMLARGMALARTGEVRDITETEDAEREQRGNVELFYNTIQCISDVVLAIEGLDITGNYQRQFNDYNTLIQLRSI